MHIGGKKYISFFFIAVTLFAGAVLYVSKRVYSFHGNRIIPVDANGKRFYCEVVSEKEKRIKGLGGRDRLCESCGMIFLFPNDGMYAFRMRDMRFDLDIIWIEKNRIVHMEKNVSHDFEGNLVSLLKADSVLEINAGSADAMGFKIGDRVLSGAR